MHKIQAMEDKIHKVQIQILKGLLFRPNSRFTDLNITGLANDHFTFHIKRLVELELVEKNKNKYRLTINGKEFANRMNTDTLKMEKQAKLGVRIIALRGTGSSKEYLMQQRLKEPFFGIWGFPGGKISWGETIYEAAEREFEEETGLKGKLVFKGIVHKMDKTKEGVFLEDKFFYVFKTTNPKGKLIKEIEGHQNKWIAKKDVSKLKRFKDIGDVLRIKNSKNLKFIEKYYQEEIEKY